MIFSDFFLVVGAVAAGAVYYNSILNVIPRPEATKVILSDEQLEEILGFVPEKIESQETEPVAEKACYCANQQVQGHEHFGTERSDKDRSFDGHNRYDQ